jgi:hypothetical protein
VATAQGIRAGRAFVELFADDSKLVRGLRAAEKKLKAFGDSIRNLGLKMVGVGSAILAPLAASAKLFGSYGDSVAKMAANGLFLISGEPVIELTFQIREPIQNSVTMPQAPTPSDIGTSRL